MAKNVSQARVSLIFVAESKIAQQAITSWRNSQKTVR